MPPRQPSNPKPSPYITAEGFRKLESELKALWARRAEVTQHLAAAAAEGDRSENAEYIYRKKELRELDRRIRYLQKRLPNLKLVDKQPDSQQKIFFGAWIVLEKGEGQIARYRIVGTDETDSQKGWISIDAPMSRALLKKEVDDKVSVQTPGGESHYTILDISYTPPSTAP